MSEQQTCDTNNLKWKALVNCDNTFDGDFFYGVLTTGVYCRPSCSSRKPNRVNVEFFATREQAEAQGYRPCKKCRPDENGDNEKEQHLIVTACRRLEHSTSPPTLAELAAEAGMSPHHFHRLFKKTVGITPRNYYAKHRADRLREALVAGSKVGEAIYAAGFESLSGAYNKDQDQFAMSMKAFKNGAEGVVIMYGTASCFLGQAMVAATRKGICMVELGDTPEQLVDKLTELFPHAKVRRGDKDFQTLVEKVITQIESPQSQVDLPLDIQGTVFQQKVWRALRGIEPGNTSSYSAIATQIGQPTAVRAVAGACAANKIAVLIPCHRVLTKDNKISGYRWGKGRKKLLLEKERK